MSTAEQSHPELSPADEPSRVRRVPDAFDREEWERLSNGFVDDPRGTVEEADKALREQIHRLINRLSSKQSRLMRHCGARPDASTEELRECFRQYREMTRRVAEMTPND